MSCLDLSFSEHEEELSITTSYVVVLIDSDDPDRPHVILIERDENDPDLDTYDAEPPTLRMPA